MPGDYMGIGAVSAMFSLAGYELARSTGLPSDEAATATLLTGATLLLPLATLYIKDKFTHNESIE